MIKGFLDSRIPFIFALFLEPNTMSRLLYILCVASLLSCTKAYRIKGTSNLTGLDGKTVSLMTAVDSQWELIDSCELLHCAFRMNGRVDSTMIATLFLDGQAVMPLILEPGKIDVVISDFMLNVSGAPLNDSLYAFIAEKYKLDLRAVELERIEPQMIMNGHAPEEIEAYVLPEGKVIYLKAGVWTASEAYFEAWVWGAGDQWCEFADIDDSGIFRTVVPNGPTGMKILRKDYKTAASHDWSSWNDSGDQTIPADKNMFIVNNWDNYSWGTK